MFAHTDPEVLVVASVPHLKPHLISIWSQYQDDGFGTMIDTWEFDIKDNYYTPYIVNYLGYDYESYPSYFCNYGDH